MRGLRQLGEVFSKIAVLGAGLVVERVGGEVIDQVEEPSPGALAPEPTEVDAAKGKVRLDRVAIATDQRDEASASPGRGSLKCSMYFLKTALRR